MKWIIETSGTMPEQRKGQRRNATRMSAHQPERRNPLAAKWRNLGEGPFSSYEEAESFAQAEVGVPYRISAKA